MSKTMLIPLLWLLLALPPVAGAGDNIEVYQLQGRTPEELIPVLKPLVGDAALSGMGTRLIVKGSPEQQAQVRSLLDKLDRPPRRLLIEVSNDRSLLASNRGLRVDGGVRLGDQVGVTTDGRTDGIRARVRDSQTRSDASGRQRVQTLEGQRAFINTGQSIAVHEPSVGAVDGVLIQQDRVTYRDVRSGFYVVPQLNGDQVTLRILQHDDRVGPRGSGAIDVQSAATTVRGRLGEWIELGGVSSQVDTRTHGLTRYRSTLRESDRTVLVRVLPLD